MITLQPAKFHYSILIKYLWFPYAIPWSYFIEEQIEIIKVKYSEHLIIRSFVDSQESLNIFELNEMAVVDFSAGGT